VCLTEETVETLYLLDEDARIVGVSGYAVRPARVRKEKPRVSAFVSADIPKILALDPDLVFTFSDLQADIVRDLIKAGVAVHAFNHRNIAGILAMIRTVGALVGCLERALALAQRLDDHLARIRAEHRDRKCRLRKRRLRSPQLQPKRQTRVVLISASSSERVTATSYVATGTSASFGR
jgi:iron complex transport system substrate-binding protein